MSESNYYDSANISMKYLEIGIALSVIDRMNPGKIPFCIPSITPNTNKSSTTDKKIIQASKTNILTDNKDAVDVSNIEVSNYIYIDIPKELTALPGAVYDVSGDLDIKGSGDESIVSANIAGTGLVSERLGKIDVHGGVSGNISSINLNTKVNGKLDLVLSNEYRYIPQNSKWLISFIGGDMSMPCVICRLPD